MRLNQFSCATKETYSQETSHGTEKQLVPGSILKRYSDRSLKLKHVSRVFSKVNRPPYSGLGHVQQLFWGTCTCSGSLALSWCRGASCTLVGSWCLPLSMPSRKHVYPGLAPLTLSKVYFCFDQKTFNLKAPKARASNSCVSQMPLQFVICLMTIDCYQSAEVYFLLCHYSV